jgi:CBS domain-containing protein
MPDEREGAVTEFIEAAERTLHEGKPAAAAFDETLLRQPLSVLEPRSPIVVDADASVLEAVTAMREARVGCVLVVKSGRLEGIFTERDVLTHVAGRGPDADATPLRDVMTHDPEYLRPTDSIAYALNAMSLGGYRHVPLVDDSRVPVGVVSVRDVIHFLVRQFPKSVMNLPTLPRQNYVREREGA